MQTVNVTTKFITHTCATHGCGVAFAIEDGFDDRRRDDKRTFYCPSGHSLSYGGDTEAVKQRKRAEKLERQLAARDADLRLEQTRLTNERNAHRATKGVLTKTKKRVANGVCPCCKRHFVDLERHMTGQHPDFADATL